MTKDITEHKYYCWLGEKICGNFKKRGGPCKKSCKKEKHMYMALCEGQVDCDYPFNGNELEEATGEGFIDFMLASGLMR